MLYVYIIRFSTSLRRVVKNKLAEFFDSKCMYAYVCFGHIVIV